MIASMVPPVHDGRCVKYLVVNSGKKVSSNKNQHLTHEVSEMNLPAKTLTILIFEP